MIFHYVKSTFLNKGFKKYFLNTSWLLAEKIIRLFLGLFIGIWIARYLGAKLFGEYNYIQSFVGLVITISTMGLDGIIVRELINKPEKINVLLGSSLIIRLIGSIIVMLLLIIGTTISDNSRIVNLYIYIFGSSTFFQSFHIISSYFQSKVWSKYFTVVNIVSLIIVSALKIYFIEVKAPLINFIYILLLENVLLTIGLIYFYTKIVGSIFEWKPSFYVMKQLISDSWPLIFSGILVSIYVKIDQVMIMKMIGDEALGNYAAAVRLSEIWYFIPMIICNSVFPGIINTKHMNPDLYELRIGQLYTAVSWFSILVALPITCFGDFIVTLLYGNEFPLAADVLKLHVWSGVFVSFGVASGKWLINENLQKIAFTRSFLGALINIVLNIYLMDRMGIYGAALSTLISYAFVGYFSDLLLKKTRSQFLLKTNSLFLVNIFRQVRA